MPQEPQPSPPHLRILLALALCLGPFADVGAGATETPAGRVVAIGDVHGAIDGLVDILGASGLIDEEQNWIGHGTTLVQTGDLTDRGSEVRAVLDLLTKLERQAEAAGDRVELLLGNHEAMNLIMNDRDALVNPEIFSRFADADSERRRDEAYASWKKYVAERNRARMRSRGGPNGLSPELEQFLDADRDDWFAAHPPGLIEYRSEFGVDGGYAKWLRELPVVAVVGDSLFIHGGLSPEHLKLSPDEINQLHWKHLEKWVEDRRTLEERGLVLPFFSWAETRLALTHHLTFPASPEDRSLALEIGTRQDLLREDLFSAESPLWYRGYAHPPLGLADPELGELLTSTEEQFHVRRVVAGHTPQMRKEIETRLDERLFLIDTGMLVEVYKGTPAALEITAAGVMPIYARKEALPPEGRTFAGADGSPLPFQELEAIERFLLEAQVVSSKPVGQGKSGAIKLSLEHDGVRANAIFHQIDLRNTDPREASRIRGTRVPNFIDSYRSQVGAYHLGKLLGLANMPPSVLREIDGSKGSVSLWIENGSNLFGRKEAGEPAPRSIYFARQMHDLRVFDNLIANIDRNSQNIFWTAGESLWLIDHTRTLSRNSALPKSDEIKRCSRSLYQAIESLDPKTAEEKLAPYLPKFAIKAIFDRREKLLAVLAERIARLGEGAVFFNYGDPVGVTIEEAE